MGWRGKLVFLLIVYFAGFATAVYFLAPAPEGASSKALGEGFVNRSLKSDELVRSVNSGLHKAVGLGKDVFREGTKYIKQKIDEKDLLGDS